MRRRFPDSVISILTAGGWTGNSAPRHKKVTASSAVMFPAADEVICEFGGLRFGSAHRGVECAASMVEIGAEFSQGLENELKVRSSDFGCRLVVIGQIDQGHAELVMDERGEVYYLFDPLKKIASSIDEALVMLLLGYRPAHPLPPCLFEEIETP